MKCPFVLQDKDNVNPLWPQFNDAVQLKKTILMPELVSYCVFTSHVSCLYHVVLVSFAVNISIHRKLKAGTKQILLGQNVFPLASLKPGE